MQHNRSELTVARIAGNVKSKREQDHNGEEKRWKEKI